jgi:hypothetical protein
LGTNFYWTDELSEYANGDRRLYTERRMTRLSNWDHIGKRAAAGPYCWDCMVTLNVGGGAAVHRDQNWLDRCPICQQAQPEAPIMAYAASVELGWTADRKLRPHGTGSASSFTWAQDPVSVCLACMRFPATGIIQSSYNEIYTGSRFLKMLEYNCPIQFYDAIGSNFT